jgi:sporulation protein YlmC with PRC-barrel domain
MRNKKEDEMLRSLKSLIGYRIHATDGEMGHVDDFYFDDRDWSVRHIAVDLGQWRDRRQILLGPKAVQDDSMNRVLAVPLTRRQVEERPGIDTDPPVARQEEKIFHTYYAWPPYVGGGGFFSMDPFVPEFYFQASLHDPNTSPFEVVGQANGDRHLQSAREMIGYHVQATDGPIGHVEDLVLDDSKWRIRYLVVHTHEWIPAAKLLVSSRLVDELSWPAAKVYLNVPRSRIEHSKKFDPSAPASRVYEEVEFDYYGRPKRWNKLTRAVNRSKSRTAPHPASREDPAKT